MSRAVALMVVMLAGCHAAAPVVVEPPSPERPLTLSAQTVAAWEAYCVRPSCPDCDLPSTSVDDKMVDDPDADDPDAVIASIRSGVTELIGSVHPTSTLWALWYLYDALPLERRAELLPELRMLARHEFLDGQQRRLWTHEAWLRLAALRDPEILPLLRTALADTHDWEGQLAAAEALREYGEDADAPEARALYDAPWDPRWPVLVTDVVWPEEALSGWDRQYAPWSFDLDGRRVSFASTPHAKLAVPEALADLHLVTQYPDVPAGRAWTSSLTVAQPIAGGWLLGTDSGEFGGDAWWVDAQGRARHLANTNVVAWIELGGTPYLLTGLAHGSSYGALLEVQPDADGVALRYAFTLFDAPEHYAVQDDRLLLATDRGVAVVSADLTQRLLPYATERTAPSRPPERYQKVVQRRAEASKSAIEACLEPLRGRTSTCHRRVPPGVGLWLEVDEIGAVSATVPFTQRDDPWSRPPAPAVAACLADVTRSWTFDPAPQGWTSFGYVFNLSTEG